MAEGFIVIMDALRDNFKFKITRAQKAAFVIVLITIFIFYLVRQVVDANGVNPAVLGAVFIFAVAITTFIFFHEFL